MPLKSVRSIQLCWVSFLIAGMAWKNCISLYLYPSCHLLSFFSSINCWDSLSDCSHWSDVGRMRAVVTKAKFVDAISKGTMGDQTFHWMGGKIR